MLAAVTLFASCSQEEIVTKTDGESLVSFTVTTPELGSRADIGDALHMVLGTSRQFGLQIGDRCRFFARARKHQRGQSHTKRCA